GDVLAARNRDLGHASVDSRRDVEPRRIHLALHQERFPAYEIPDRQTGNGGDDQADDDGRDASGGGRRFLRRLLRHVLWRFLWRFGRDLRSSVSRWLIHPTLH